MDLRGFLEKIADADFLREVIGFAAERDGDGCGAATTPVMEKSPLRNVQRSGCRTGIGDACPRDRAAHPQIATGLLLPSFLEPRRMAEK